MKTLAIQTDSPQANLHVQPTANGVIPSIAHRSLEWIRLIFASFVSLALSPYYLIVNLTGFGKHTSSLPKDNGNVDSAHSPLVQTLIDYRKMIFTATAIGLTFITVAYGVYAYGINVPTYQPPYNSLPRPKYFSRPITKMAIPSLSPILLVGLGVLAGASCLLKNRAEKDEIEVGSLGAQLEGSIVPSPSRHGTQASASFLDSVGDKFLKTVSQRCSAIFLNSLRSLTPDAQERRAAWDVFKRTSLDAFSLSSPLGRSLRASLDASVSQGDNAAEQSRGSLSSISDDADLLRKLDEMSPRGSLDTEEKEGAFLASANDNEESLYDSIVFNKDRETPSQYALRRLAMNVNDRDGNFLAAANAALEDKLQQKGVKVKQVDCAQEKDRIRERQEQNQARKKQRIEDQVLNWKKTMRIYGVIDPNKQKELIKDAIESAKTHFENSGTVKIKATSKPPTKDYRRALRGLGRDFLYAYIQLANEE